MEKSKTATALQVDLGLVSLITNCDSHHIKNKPGKLKMLKKKVNGNIYLFAGEQHRRRRQTELKIGSRRLSHRSRTGHKVQQIVDQLEGQAEVASVLVRQF